GICDTPGEIYDSFNYVYRDNHLSRTPALSLVYDIASNWSAYAGYTDIHQSQSTYVDHDLRPIDPLTGSNIEAGVRWEAQGGRLNASLAAYRIEKKNYALLVDYGAYTGTRGALPDGIHNCCYSSDSNKMELSRGADLEVTGEVLRDWQIYAGYTF